MINFYVSHIDKQLTIEINKSLTFYDLINTINDKFGLSGDDIKVILLGYGVINDLSELPIESLDLGDGKYHVIVHNLNNPNLIWKNYCTRNIIGNQLLFQEGYHIDDKFPVCYACNKYCCELNKVKIEIIDKEFICMCQTCILSDYNYNDKEIIFANIHSILVNHSKLIVHKEESKIKKLKDEILARDFNFVSS